MDDPELHGDERILIRTAGVHVKSISFEAILTNKRIVLIDRIKNILPPKEIPLATIQTVEAGENAIRGTVITLALGTKDGRIRQMVLTFSRESGGNRAKERNEWVRLIKENIIPSFEQVSTVVSGIDPAEKAGPVSIPKFKIVGSPVPQTPAARYEQAAKPQPVKKTVESRSAASWQAPAPAPAPASESILGIYCTRCGAKVPEGSGFCNKCGYRIIVTGEVPQVPVAIPPPAAPVQTVKTGGPIDHEISYREPLIEPSPVNVPHDPLFTVPPEPAIVQKTQPAAAPASAPPQKRFMPRFFSPKDNPSPPPVPNSRSTETLPSMPPAKPRSRKKLVFALGIVIVIIIAVVAVVVVLPKTGSIRSILPGFSSSGSSTTATTVPATQVMATSTTPVIINQAASIITSVPVTPITVATTTPVIINQAASIVT